MRAKQLELLERLESFESLVGEGLLPAGAYVYYHIATRWSFCADTKVLVSAIDASVMAVAERLKIQRVLTTGGRDFSVLRPRHCIRTLP
jgi:hypothetical protein